MHEYRNQAHRSGSGRFARSADAGSSRTRRCHAASNRHVKPAAARHRMGFVKPLPRQRKSGRRRRRWLPAQLRGMPWPERQFRRCRPRPAAGHPGLPGDDGQGQTGGLPQGQRRVFQGNHAERQKDQRWPLRDAGLQSGVYAEAVWALKAYTDARTIEESKKGK